MKNIFDIAIIGGGASGMAAALSAAKERPGLKIVLLERQARVGKKLLATGNGRCNLTNLSAGNLRHYHGGAYFARPALSLYPPETIRAFFAHLGLETIADEEGRVYPLSDQAAAVVDVLRLSLEEKNISVMGGFEVCRIEKGFTVFAQSGEKISARRVILSCGGPAGEKLGGTRSGHKLLKSLGHAVTPLYPALCQLKTPPEAVRALKGIKYRGGLSLLENGKTVQQEKGEILFTDYGLTGIAAMALCRKAAMGLASGKKMQVKMELCPVTQEQLTSRKNAFSTRLLDDFLTGLVPKRLGQQALKQAGISPLSRPASSLTNQEILSLSAILNGWTLPVTGVQPLESAQVTAGGAEVSQFDPDTLQSKLIPGLYATGEVLDIDGDCGGFNLQWAWASGMLAGCSAANSF